MEFFLKNIADISAGNTAPDKFSFTKTGKPFIRASSLEFLVRGEAIEKCEKVDDFLAKEKKLRLFAKGSIIFAKSGMSAKMGRVYILPVDAYVVSHLAIITIVNSSINANFIGRYFSYRPPLYLIKDDAYPSISLKDIGEIQINIPDLETQNKIVAILDKANSLKEKREQSVSIYDELLWSTFYDNFLDFQGREISELEDVAYVTSGLTKGKEYKDKTTYMVPYMRVANVQDGYLDLNEIKEIAATKEEAKRYSLELDDLLLTEGGDPDKLGRGTLWRDEIKGCIFQNHIFRVRVKDKNKLRPIFLSFQTASKYGKHYFLKAAKQTSGIASINSTQLKSFPVYVPPLKQQIKFETFVKKVEVFKARLKKANELTETLLKSLSKQAFSGDILYDIDIELEALIESVNVQQSDSLNSIETVKKDVVLLQRLLDKLNEQEFDNAIQYDKAKYIAFRILTEGKNLINQNFDETDCKILLTL